MQKDYIDYTNSKRAPVVICFVKHDGKFLLVKRSEKVGAYKNLWSSIAGFLDDSKTASEKATQEMEEELGIKKSEIMSIVEGPIYVFTDEKLGREWERHLVVVEISTPKVHLDWEHIDFVWISPEEISKYETPPGFETDLNRVK